MDLQPIRGAIDRALALRGTVMLTVRGVDRQWCAACGAVDGSLELRVGEPGSAWRRRARKQGEAWLQEHGFVHVIDAWAKPEERPVSWSCAELLACALREGLGAADDAELIEHLVHPGYLAGTTPPPPEAPPEEHIEHALLSLARYGESKVSIGGGRPEQTWAWAFVTDGELLLSPEPPERSTDYEHDWTVELDESAVRNAAQRLSTLLFEEFGRDRAGPLYIACMPRPGDPPLPH